MKTKPHKSNFKEWRNALVFAVAFATLFRWSLAEAYVIPTGSMENSLLVGDYILVSKIHYGPRTPQTPLQVPLTHQKIWGTEIPSYLDWIQLPSYRLPGLRNVERGEVVVFNATRDLLDPTDRPDDLMTLLVKRCVAIPGDELEIRDRQLFINQEKVENPAAMKFQYEVVTDYPLQSNHLTALGLDSDDYWFSGYNKEKKPVYSMLLTGDQFQKLEKAPYLVALEKGSDAPVGFPLFPYSKHQTWDIHEYGPLSIPQKGASIAIHELTLDLYGDIIQKFEGHQAVAIADGKLVIDGQAVETYTFQQDYYFMMGDSRHNSIDSRYYGFVPKSQIIGKPIMVLFSKNQEGKGLNKVRWERIGLGIG